MGTNPNPNPDPDPEPDPEPRPPFPTHAPESSRLRPSSTSTRPIPQPLSPLLLRHTLCYTSVEFARAQPLDWWPAFWAGMDSNTTPAAHGARGPAAVSGATATAQSSTGAALP